MNYIKKQIQGHILSESYFLTTNYYRFCLWLQKKIPEGRILSIGCNTGYEEYLMKKKKKIIGIDIGKDFIIEARERGIDAIVMDVHNLGFPDNEFDAIYWNNGPEHSINPEKAFSECYRVLKPGGKFISALPSNYRVPDFTDPANLWDSSLHVYKPTPEEFKKLLEDTGFEIIEFEEINTIEKFGLTDAASDNFMMVSIARKEKEGKNKRK